MLINASNPLPPATAASTAVTAMATTPRWQPGQVLTAEVIGTPSQNYTQLRIDGQVVNARSALPLQSGQRLALTVQATSPEVVLKAAATPLTALPETPLSRGLARALPRQGTAEQTLTLLRGLVSAGNPASGTSAPRLSPALAAGAAQFLRQLPHQAVLTEPARLRAVLSLAAQPTERQLLGTVTDTAANASRLPSLREGPATALAQLRHAFDTTGARDMPSAPAARRTTPEVTAPRSTAASDAPDRSAAAERLLPHPDMAHTPDPARLRELLDGALARIQAQHLHNAGAVGTPGTPLIVELPVRLHERVDLWRFEIVDEEATTGSNPSSAPRARVSVRLLLGDDIVFAAELSVTGDSVGIRMGTNDACCNAALARDAGTLDQRMQERGLAIAALVIDAATATPRQAPRLPQRLLDERA